MKKFLCVHGHFYQPPRENPWLEEIEVQDSAFPYHDWNERITAECYAPNSAARILNEKNQIVQIVNTYARISFNFGPTLLSWFEAHQPEVYQAILEADKESMKRFAGHGSAMAQAYNHLIMPLANRRDKETQIDWGLADFRRRFQREPEGMWLPETAVDVETLEILADRGVVFTVLAPNQARRVRKKGETEWTDVSGSKVDPRRPYTVPLPSGKSIVVFFYDGPSSRAVAFEKLLVNGEFFAARLSGGFSLNPTEPELVHIATDGETYGHHHRYGEMALAYAMDFIDAKKVARVTNYGEYLSLHQPEYEAEIFENSSWSCAHGVDRWKADCGCNSGMKPGWHQKWRAPLRESLDWLRDTLSGLYEDKARSFLKDPWKARTDYINVILDRSDKSINAFFNDHCLKDLSDTERTVVLKLLEVQRQTLLMYTSCGWFFDDLSGIETVQVIQYAGRAIQLAKDVLGHDLEETFRQKLEAAPTNISEYQNGRWIYDHFVKSSIVDLKKVGAHYAIASLFQNGKKESRLYGFQIKKEKYESHVSGKARIAMGILEVSSIVTGERERLTFCVLHLGDHNLSGGVRPFQSDRHYLDMAKDMMNAFSKTDFPEIIRTMDRHFGLSTYSLKSLFKDEQRTILSTILAQTRDEAEAAYNHLYQNNAPLLHYLVELNTPLPKALQTAAEFILAGNLFAAFAEENPDPEIIREVLEEAKKSSIVLKSEQLSYAVEKSLERLSTAFRKDPFQVKKLTQLKTLCALLKEFPFDVNLWRVQNDFFKLMKDFYPMLPEKAAADPEAVKEWISLFKELGESLRIFVPDPAKKTVA